MLCVLLLGLLSVDGYGVVKMPRQERYLQQWQSFSIDFARDHNYCLIWFTEPSEICGQIIFAPSSLKLHSFQIALSANYTQSHNSANVLINIILRVIYTNGTTDCLNPSPDYDAVDVRIIPKTFVFPPNTSNVYEHPITGEVIVSAYHCLYVEVTMVPAFTPKGLLHIQVNTSYAMMYV